MHASASPNLSRTLDSRELEGHYAALVEGSIDAIVGLTREGLLTSWNPAAAALYGYSAEEAVGRTVGELFSPERRHEAEETLERLRADGGVVYFDTEHARRDGSVVEVSVSMSPVRDASGAMIAASAIVRDISSRRRQEAELARTRAELEERARELERSNADLEQFAYVASHDLAEPLRAITGFLELLQRRYGEQLDETAGRYVNQAVDGATRMRILLNDLLLYSRVGRGGGEPTQVDLMGVVEQVKVALGPSLREAGATVEAEALPTVRGDQRELTQLLQNLLANAVKFRSDVSPHVTVKAEREDRGWRLSVADNGIGIEPQHLGRIFVPFKRLHTRDEYPGTGIGLGICKKIVEARGGEIFARSTGGGGTVFTFTLPDAPEVVG